MNLCAKKRKGNRHGVNDLVSALDTNQLSANFLRFAGGDEKMDASEFDNFTKKQNITRQQAASLWLLLDRDGNGLIEKHEFAEAIVQLQQYRAWLRFCPDCIYQNSCSYCLECNASCDFCSEQHFCATHWEDHPARNRDEQGATDGDGGGNAAAPVNAAEMLREQLLIRPLTWMYESPMMGWLPMAPKAALRRVLRAQQLASKEATRLAKAEEEAAKRARGAQSDESLLLSA